MTKLLSIGVLAVLAALTNNAFLAAQQRERSVRPSWDAWVNAINTHEPGELDQAVEDVAPWSLRDLQIVIENVTRQSAAGQPPASHLRAVARGIVLHADIAILHRVPGGYDLPTAGSTTAVLLKDGRRIGQMGSTVHWEVARRLLEPIPKIEEERTRLGRQFYRAAGAVLQQWGEFPELTTHLSAGRRFLGEDPVLLLYEGTQRQAYAGSKLQQYYEERRAAQRRPLPPNLGGMPAAGESRQQAERLFRRALALDPGLVEARIRLAHVLSDLGRQDAAATEIEAAMKTALPDLLEYYGALVLGRVQRARQQLDAARDAFERAAAILPDAPAPRFGLSDVAMARGDRTASLDLLPRATPADVTEPWWATERLHEPTAEKLIDALRREARQ